MFFQPLDLSTALRPILLPDEALLFVQNGVGLYEGKYKIPTLQDGHAYLTSHRVCYVDDVEPRKRSVAVELKGIEKYEFYARFFKSSPKILLYPKTTKPSFYQTRNPSSPSFSSRVSSSSQLLSPNDTPNSRPSTTTWICLICTFSNPIPSNFDITTANAYTPIPACLACGIKPSLTQLLKAAISSASGRQNPLAPSTDFWLPQPIESGVPNNPSLQKVSREASEHNILPQVSEDRFRCPRCTFRNHPQLLSCELCGGPLLGSESPKNYLSSDSNRSASPGPVLESNTLFYGNFPEYIKLSFRDGGEKTFYEKLEAAMIQRKWLLQNAPPVPKPSRPKYESYEDGFSMGDMRARDPLESRKVVGIAGLERLGQEQRKNNEYVIGSAFEDLEALMASAKEIITLAESFAKSSSDGVSAADASLLESANALGMVTTKDMLSANPSSDSLYISELSRNLAEYLTDDARGLLKKEGGVMSLVDLWAVFNRAKGSVDLVSPLEFGRAVHSWEKLNLPVRLRQFKNGLMVVQHHDWSDDKTIAQLLAWLQELHKTPPPGKASWDWVTFGRGITARDAAERFGWSIGVASEELEMAEEKGVLCREEGVEGLRFWENFFLDGSNFDHGSSQLSSSNGDAVIANLQDLGFV